MLENYEIVYAVSSVIYFFYIVAQAVVSIFCYTKYKHVGTGLMVIGAVFSFLMFIVEKLIYFVVDMYEITSFITYQGFLYILGNLGSLAFVIGLFVFIYNTNFSKKNSVQLPL